MTLLLWLLTIVMVLNCLFLILLVLVQLPKKEAGIGQAFGGAATDALFGAGSGNLLTKVTKYSAGLFLVLALGLSMLTASAKRGDSERLRQELEKQARKPASVPAPPANALQSGAGAVSNAAQAVATNAATLTSNLQEALGGLATQLKTNAATNTPPAAPKKQ
jgi:preprotein translocase subunit SecG